MRRRNNEKVIEVNRITYVPQITDELYLNKDL